MQTKLKRGQSKMEFKIKITNLKGAIVRTLAASSCTASASRTTGTALATVDALAVQTAPSLKTSDCWPRSRS